MFEESVWSVRVSFTETDDAMQCSPAGLCGTQRIQTQLECFLTRKCARVKLKHEFRSGNFTFSLQNCSGNLELFGKFHSSKRHRPRHHDNVVTITTHKTLRFSPTLLPTTKSSPTFKHKKRILPLPETKLNSPMQKSQQSHQSS